MHGCLSINGAAAGATLAKGVYLPVGEMATMLDAEMVGIVVVWEEGYQVVASDSQAAIK